MKKFFVIFLFLTMIFSGALSAFFDLEKMFYSEFSINYSTVLSPSFIENNTTGTLDTPALDGKIGFEIIKWLDVYAGLSFYFFVEQKNKQNHYTFIPVFAGLKVNLFPEFTFYPSLYFETGKSISNYHYTVLNILTMSVNEMNIPWTGDYYNIGLAINWKINDIFTLALDFERPWISYYNKDINEIHIFKSGFSFKILY